jgi:hypothetical protein
MHSKTGLERGITHAIIHCQTTTTPPHKRKHQAPEDAWLLEGLASWLEGNILRSLLGANDVAYRRWQERVALAAVDDGAQLAPLSQVVPGLEEKREKDRGGRREREREKGAAAAAAAVGAAEGEEDGGAGAGGGGAGRVAVYQGPSVNKDTTSGWGLTYGTQVRAGAGP